MLCVSRSYHIPLAFSLGLHIAIFVALLTHFPTVNYRLPDPAEKMPIVKAEAVDQQQVEARMTAIQQERQQQRATELTRVRQLQAQAAAAQKQRIAEQHHLAQLKAEQHRVQQQKIVQAKVLATMKRQAELTHAKILVAKKKAQERALANKERQLQQQLFQQQIHHEQKQLAATHAQQLTSVIDRYKAEILQAIGQQWVVPSDANRRLSCQFLIHVAPGGAVMEVQLLHGSGNTALDRSARVAIYKASPLPVPNDPALFDRFRLLRLTVSPKEIVQP